MAFYDIQMLLHAFLIVGGCMRLTSGAVKEGRTWGVSMALSAPGGRKAVGKRNRLKKGEHRY